VTDGSFVDCEGLEDVERGGQSLSIVEVGRKRSRITKSKIGPKIEK
jgi:hypothetical protein